MISKLLLGGGGGVAVTSGVGEDVLHGGSLLVAQLPAGGSARVEGRTEVRAIGVTVGGNLDSVNVLLLASGSSLGSQGAFELIGLATLEVRTMVFAGLLKGVGVRVRRVELRRVVLGTHVRRGRGPSGGRATVAS